MLAGACVCCALFQNFFIGKAVCAVRKVNDAAANVTVLFERVLHDDVAGMRIASHGGDTRFKRELRAVGHQKRCRAALLRMICRHNAVHAQNLQKILCARYKYEHIQNYTIFCLPFQGKTCIILKYAVKYVPRTEKAKAVGIYRGICERTGLRGGSP